MTNSDPAPTVWCVHNHILTTELVDEAFIAVGWDEVGDLAEIPTWDELKARLSEGYPDAKPGAVAQWAGNLWRFEQDIRVGDIVVAPFRPDSTLNLGVVTGEYRYDAEADTFRHRRDVDWRQIGLSRTIFTQGALYEIGSLLTVSRVRRNAAEFIAAMRTDQDDVELLTEVVDAVADQSADDDESLADEPRASRIARHTRDFILEALHRRLTHREFEEFTADVLRALGYQARVTRYVQDGGVDVIAHRDPLGVEPPQIKIQCKHQTSTIGSPEVQQLIGTQGPGELCVFVTLGTYSRDALSIERQRAGLRLLSGEDMVDLVLEHYAALPERWRSVVPLTPVLVVSDAADD